jgi:hypothetical protein
LFHSTDQLIIMTRTTRAQLDQLAQALSERYGAEIWVQHSGSGYAIRQTVGASSAAWEHDSCMTASEVKRWLAGALAVHSITRRAADPAAF